MKNTYTKLVLTLYLTVFATLLYSSDKATLYYKNGEKLECDIEQYELGKWVVIIDETGTKRIISWDTIKEVVFIKTNDVQDSAISQNPTITLDSIKTIVSAPSLSTDTTQIIQEESPDVSKTETVQDSIKKEPETLTIAQKLAKREKERKKQEALEAQKKLADDIEKHNKKKKGYNKETEPVVAKTPATPAESKTESKSIFDIFKKKKAPITDTEEPSVNTKEDKFKEEIKEENKYEKPEIDLNKKSGKLSVDYYQTLESDATRRAWIEDGGLLKGYGFTANYSYTSMSEKFLQNMMKEAIRNDMPYEMSISSDGTTMHGFGMSYSGTLKWIKPPSYSEGKNIWSAFSIGGTSSFSLTLGKSDMTITMYDVPYIGTMILESKSNMTITTIEFSGNIGYTFGLGKYFSSDSWKGVMLGLYWKPNFMMMTGSSESDGVYTDIEPQSNFNLTGFQWTIDWGDFGAMVDKIANEAHLSINGYIIPETEKTPFMFSIGLGIVYY
ncbi:MAG: hypothetical protein L6407_03355 [Candidatus Delongbacteria bacterium]|nr:hypothetical protein [Candidatus Delongbacteria bacterium]